MIFYKKKINLKKFILLTTLLLIYIFICAYSYVSSISHNISNQVFRLHVIANSDSSEDQNLKYIVRDNLINYMNSICSNSKSKEETIKIVSAHLSEFNSIANSTIKDCGFNYTSKVEIGNFKFPTKKYADISFPSGFYDALEVKIGNAKGQNWWCVLYPSLCFVDISSGIVPEDSKKILQNTLNTEEYSLISSNNNSYFSFKFKLVELFNQNNLITAKNQ